MLHFKPLSSAIETVVFSFQDFNIRLLVQRDDQIHPLLSGNKYRKLQAFVNPDTAGYVSFGGAWSNHLLAVATLARLQGVAAIGYVRGDEQRPMNLYERWLMQLGMELKHVSRKFYADKPALYAHASSANPQYQLIPEGGHPQPHAEAFDQWVSEIPEHVSHILVSCGTGASLLGLAEALNKLGRSIHLWGISAVSSPKFIAQLNTEARKRFEHAQVFASVEAQAFGKNTSSERHLAKTFFEQTGIATDPIYDSRVLTFLIQAFTTGMLQEHEQILWLHSGGLTGWAGYASESHELFGL